MTKYKILKDYISPNGYLIKAGEIRDKGKNIQFTRALIKNRFVEEICDNPKSLDDLKDNDEWFYLNCGDNECYIARTTSISFLQAFREVGWAFLTREEGEEELARIKAREILKQDTKGFKPDWRTYGQDKYCVYYNHTSDCLDYNCYGYHQRSEIIFASKEDVEASIKDHESEWLAYFGIEKDGQNGTIIDC